MPTLKDIKSFRLNLADSALAKSPLWNQRAAEIVPAQIYAFKARLKLEGNKDVSYLFRKIVRAIAEAKQAGDITDAPILAYSEPEATLTSPMFRERFERMSRPTPAAILFALETGIDAEALITLTWKDVKGLKLKSYARLILEAQPVHIAGKYVVWRQNAKGKPEPLFGLEMEVFEHFRMVWSELESAYKVMIAADPL